MTLLDLGDCEKDLRDHYNISDDKILYMKKMDVYQEGMKIPKIEYSVYCKLNGTNLIPLDLTVCENSKIILSIPIDISENLDKLNTSSEYFNNICYSSKSDSGTDISLKDRKKEFVEGNKTVCQEDCLFADYNSDNKQVNCSCIVKETSNDYKNMNINKTKLYYNFKETNDKKEISNLGITSCSVLTSKENIESNAGFFSLLIILAIFIIIFIIFCTKGYNNLENKIDEVIHKTFKNEAKNKDNKLNKNNKITNSHIKETTTKSKIKIKNDKKVFTKTKKVQHKSINIKTSGQRILNNRHFETLNQRKTTNIFQNKINNKNLDTKILKPDTDYEKNWLTYKEALKHDKRSNCDYYGSLLKSKQLFIFTFCSFNDYNSGIIKKFMLFLSFALHYTVNALFFTESTLHQIYEDEGKFNFGYQYPYIIISAIISTVVLRIMLQVLILTDKDILEVKQQETRPLAFIMKKQKLKNIKIKYSLFFVINFILLSLFWYYLTCFNAVYKNTQVYLIENTFISFAFSLFYPFIINIFPTLLRNCAIHSSDKNQECLYKFSQIIQLI